MRYINPQAKGHKARYWWIFSLIHSGVYSEWEFTIDVGGKFITLFLNSRRAKFEFEFWAASFDYKLKLISQIGEGVVSMSAWRH